MPLLWQDRAGAQASGGNVPGSGQLVFQALPALFPQAGVAGSEGVYGRASAGQVLGDARQALRQHEEAQARRYRRVCKGHWLGHDQV